MAKEETLKEAWEKLPAWKKTWFKIVAIMVVLSFISALVYSCNSINDRNEAEKEAEKIVNDAKKEAEKEMNKMLEEVEF